MVAVNTTSPSRTELPVEKPLSAIGSYAEEIPANSSVVGNLNSQFKYSQESEGPFQEMSKGASCNPYLTKLAMSGVARAVGRGFRDMDSVQATSLGMSAAGLGMSAVGLRNSTVTAKATSDKANIERKSLTALNSISKSIASSTVAPAPIDPKRSVGNKYLDKMAGLATHKKASA